MIVKVYAILAWVGAVALALAGFGAMLGGHLWGRSMTGYHRYGMMGGAYAGFGVVDGIVILVLAVLAAFVGISLWRRQKWTRVVLLIFGALGVLSIFRFSVGCAAVGAVTVWLFGFEPIVTGLFGAKPFNAGTTANKTRTNKKK